MKKIYMITAYEDYSDATTVLGVWTEKKMALLQAEHYADEAYGEFDYFLVQEYELDSFYESDYENVRVPLTVKRFKAYM